MASSAVDNARVDLSHQDEPSEKHLDAPSASTTDISDADHTATEPEQTTDATSNDDTETDSEDGPDEDEDEDEDDEPFVPDWNPIAFPFLRRINKVLSSQSAPPGLTFSAHQKHWHSIFNTEINYLKEAKEHDSQLTHPPTTKIELEILDYEELEKHGCGLHCPCDLDEERDVSGKIIVVEDEAGLTKGGLLATVRDEVYGEGEEEGYAWARDVFVGGLDFRGFNWMSFGHSPASGARAGVERDGLPCLYFEVSGKRRDEKAEGKGSVLDERGIPLE